MRHWGFEILDFVIPPRGYVCIEQQRDRFCTWEAVAALGYNLTIHPRQILIGFSSPVVGASIAWGHH
jgi:hypothetical protein